MRTLAALGVASYLGLWSAQAYACSCAPPTLTRTVLPRDGLVGFPIDGRLRILLQGFPHSLIEQLHRDYRLVDDRGAEVPLTATSRLTLVELTPKVPLRPTTRYTLEQAFVFSPDGSQLTDSDRWYALAWSGERTRALRNTKPEIPPQLRRAFVPVSAFVTGATHSTVRPVAPVVRSSEVSFAFGGGDCGPATTLQAKSSSGTGSLLEVEVRDLGVVQFLPPSNSAAGLEILLSDLLCISDKVHLGRRKNFVLRLTAVDASGALRATGDWFGAAPDNRKSPWGGEVRDEADEPLREADPPLSVEMLSSWFDVPLVKFMPPKFDGPSACPHGLEVAKRENYAPVSPARTSTALPFGIDGSGRWWLLTFIEDGKESHLESANQRLPLQLPAYEPSFALLPDGFLIAGPVFDAKFDSQLVVQRLDAKGQFVWQTTATAVGSNWSPTAVTNGETGLIAWETGHGARHPRLALVSMADGGVIGPDYTGSMVLDEFTQVGITADADGYWVLWPAPYRTHRGVLVHVDATGNTREVALPAEIDSYATSRRSEVR